MKNGFTLIELLAVIAILGVLAVVAVPTINTSLQKSKERLAKSQEKQIIKGAKDMFSDVDDNGKLKYGSCLPGYTISCEEENLECDSDSSLENDYSNCSLCKNAGVTCDDKVLIIPLEIIQNDGYLPADIKNPETNKQYDSNAFKIEIRNTGSDYEYKIVKDEVDEN